MHCPNCGKEAAAGLKFCRACGMTLDSVARAVAEHFDAEQALEPVEPQESESDARILRNTVYVLCTGFIIVFIGAALAVLGKQIDPWVKMTGAMLALLGMFVAILGAMYPAILGVRKDHRNASAKRELKEMEENSAGELPAGDDFVPVPSVTEVTTRNLDANKTKVSR